MKKYIIIILLSITLFSCGKKCTSTTGLMTADELSWLSYSGGETLIFKNQQGTIDTLHVSNSSFETNAGTSEDNPCNHPEQYGGIGIADVLGIAAFGIGVQHKDQWDLSIIGAYISAPNQFVFSNYTPQNNISINGNMYNNLYIMNIDTSTFTLPTIWQIFYTKANGILRYDFTKNGGVWEKN